MKDNPMRLMRMADIQLDQHNIVKLYKQAVERWQNDQNFCLWGTCSFKFDNPLSYAASDYWIDRRRKSYRRFWNAVDKKVHTSKAVEKYNTRIERLVYEEEGRSRSFFHSHFFCRANSPKELKAIINVMQNFWNYKVDGADKLHIDLYQYSDRFGGYAIKEHRLGSNQQILVDCCHLQTD